MAVLWGHVQAGTALPPESVDQAKALYPVSTDATKLASASVEEAVRMLAAIKKEIKALEDREDQFQTLVQGYMEQKATLASIDGNVLATWKSAKSSMKFDAKLFEQAMPDIYQSIYQRSTRQQKVLNQMKDKAYPFPTSTPPLVSPPAAREWTCETGLPLLPCLLWQMSAVDSGGRRQRMPTVWQMKC
jgi:hypothetical protein